MVAEYFPDGQNPKRNMHKITQALVDSLSNPTVVAVGAGVAGALGWKRLGYYQARATAKKDRENVSLNAQKDREVENHRFDKQLQFEASERQRDRDDAMHRENFEAEDRRHRETRLSDINYSKTTTSSIESAEGFVDSTQIVG